MRNAIGLAVCLLLAVMLLGHAPAAAQSSGTAQPAQAGGSGGETWPFRIVIVPDTQRYTIDRIYASDPRKEGDTREKLAVPERNRIFEQMMQWVADNAEEQNIKLLLHVGDIVEHKRNRAQYEMISRGVAKLDGKVPYVLAIGNHDGAALASEFFPVSRNPLNQKMFGGTRVEGNIASLYATLTINGRKYLVLTLGYGSFGKDLDAEHPSKDVQWADRVVREHPDHRVLFVTHALLSDARTPGDTAAFTESGQKLFDVFLKKHPNMFMCFCGHVYDKSGDGVATGFRKDLGEAKNPIYSTLFNAQWIDTNGGDGWLRLVEFHEDGSIVQKTYSPYLNEWNKAPGFEFTIPAN